MEFLWVIIGGALGSATRYATYKWVMKILPLNFPYGTLIVNVVGSFVIGLAAVIITDSFNIAQPLRLLIIVGFCGGLTTFSTFSIDNVYLLQSGHYAVLALNIASNVVLCIAMVLLGMWLASKI